MADLAAWLASQRASAIGDFALGPEKIRQDAVRHRAGDHTARGAGGRRPRRSRAQPGIAARGLRTFAPGASIPKCIEKMAANKAQGGAVAGARVQLEELKTFVQPAGVATIPGTGAGARQRGASLQPRELRLHRYPGTVRERACRRPITSRRPIPHGRPKNSATTSRAGRPALHLRSRGVAGALPAVPARESQPVASSADCSSAMRSRKAGRTTPRR